MDLKLLLKGTALEPISKDHTTFLKGIAILLIVFHNYYKWVFPITGENEFWFSADFLAKSLVYLRSDPLQFFNLFFNLLGFYGVQVFMVISAYGLTRSWNREPAGYGRFLVRRFDKLYPSFFMAGVLFIIIYIIREARVPGPSLQKDLLYQLLLVPCRGTDISGPWWFYSFIFQFYLVFPVMMLVNRKAGIWGLLGMVLTGYFVTISSICLFSCGMSSVAVSQTWEISTPK
jgi:peptidoglycan/LPS O-acetylase OafA/YrhL